MLERLVSFRCTIRRYRCRERCGPRAAGSLGRILLSERGEGCRYTISLINYPQAVSNPGIAFLLVAMSQQSSRRNVRSECLAAVLLMERMSIPACESEKASSASLRRGIAIEDTYDGLFNI